MTYLNTHQILLLLPKFLLGLAAAAAGAVTGFNTDGSDLYLGYDPGPVSPATKTWLRSSLYL